MMRGIKSFGKWAFFVLWQAICSVRYLLVLPAFFYRLLLSGRNGGAKGRPTCRFTPTCSAYAVMAILNWGAVIGLILAVYRILRCHPFGKCGRDYVPENRVHRALCRIYGIHYRIERAFGLTPLDTGEEKPTFDSSPMDHIS